VVEAREHAAARGARPYAGLGGYTRGDDLAAAVAAAGLAPVDAWLPPENAPDDDPEAGDHTPGDRARPVRIAARLGRCGGALGVIQGVVAATLIDSGAARSVLAVSGTPGGAVATLVFAPPGPPGRTVPHDRTPSQERAGRLTPHPMRSP
jgi:3-oxoacyl-[acyl-carrier-protein] synthase II